MAAIAPTQPTVIRTERGLSIAGTRITLYDVMDYLTTGRMPERIRACFHLTEQQLADVLAYIDSHRAEVEAEYQSVLQIAQDNRHYWEEHNRERLAELAARSQKLGQEPLREKLRTWRERIEPVP